MTQAHPPCFYRVSIKGVIKVNNKLLLTKEHGSKRWDLPGGGVEHSEEPDAAFRREIKEEIHAEVTYLDDTHVQPWFTYDLDPGWDRPILYLVYPAAIAPAPEAMSSGGVEIGFFDKEELEAILLEKHIEKFHQKLIALAFDNSTKDMDK